MTSVDKEALEACHALPIKDSPVGHSSFGLKILDHYEDLFNIEEEVLGRAWKIFFPLAVARVLLPGNLEGIHVGFDKFVFFENEDRVDRLH